MRLRIPLGASFATLLGCASSAPMLAVCPALDAMQPLASDACRAEREVGELAAKLADRVEDDLSPLRVRIEFDDRAAVSRVCADETTEQRQRRARRELTERLPQIEAIGPGPACLADSRLDFNRYGEQLAVVRRLLRACEREAQAITRGRTGDPAPTPIGFYDRELFVSCVNREQRQRDQIWIYDEFPVSGWIYLFEATPDAALRDVAIRVCSRERGEYRDEQIGFAHGGRDLYDCMRAQGWTPIE
jgi:hypothetical protein